MFWNEHELGLQPRAKKVKKFQEPKLDFCPSGWNWPIFNKIWEIEKLGHETESKHFDPNIIKKIIKWAKNDVT